MDIKDLKPDFERIAIALDLNASVAPFFIDKYWNGISKGEIPYNIKDNESFKAFLNENSLQAFYNDLLFLAFQFLRRNKTSEKLKEQKERLSGRDMELLESLKFLYDNFKSLKIVIKHKTENLNKSINNKQLIFEIRKALTEYYMMNDIYFKAGFSKEENIKDWGYYLGLVIAEKNIFSRKGRPKKHIFTGSYIDALQTYLQEFTELKAEEGTSISRSQASFIYKFLNQWGLIPENLSWEEDNIRHILDKFRAKKKQAQKLNNSLKGIKADINSELEKQLKAKKINKK